MSGELVTIPARGGKAAQASAGQHIKVVNTHGTQVVDAWAFNARDLDAAIALMHPEVDWPNAWEGGRVSGYPNVRYVTG